MTFATAGVAAAMHLVASTTAPAGVALEQAQRQPQSVVGTLAVYDYVTIVPQTTIALPSLPAFALTFPNSIPTAGKSFFYALSAPHAGSVPTHLDAHGPATVSGQTVSFGAVEGPITLAAGQGYTFIVYATYAAAPAPAAPKIYVANQNNGAGTLSIFNADGSPGTPERIETPATITAVTVDAAGKIYLAQHDPTSFADAVTTFLPDGSPTTPTIGGLRGITGIAVDASGKIYVASTCCGQNPTSSITTYDRSGARTTPTITAGLNAAVAIALDRNGKIYVLNACCDTGDPAPIRITTYTSAGTPTTPTIDLPASEDDPVGIAVDRAGKIYVANSTLGGSGTALTSYSPTGSASTPTIVGQLFASGVAVDASGKIYLSSLNSSITSYTQTGAPAVPTIVVGVFAPSGIAVH